MKLLPKDIAEKIPALYSQEGRGDNSLAYVKLFNPTGAGTWYIIEYDPIERIAFALCVITDAELGYVSIDEMEEYKDSQFGLGIERDLHFKPTKLKDILKGH